MITEITQEQFEKVLPVASFANSGIFDSCGAALEFAEESIAADVLGTEMVRWIETSGQGALPDLLHRAICLSTFARMIPLLDLSMSNDGFVVASTDKVSPASKERVERLMDSVYHQYLCTVDALAVQIYGNVEAFGKWRESADTSRYIRHIFWRRADLCAVFGMAENSLRDTCELFTRLYFVDPYVSQYLSFAYIEELKAKTAEGILTDYDKRLLPLLKSAYAAVLRGVPTVEAVRPPLACIKSNIGGYPTFAESPEYQATKSEFYENKKDDTTFFFGM